MYQDLQFLGKIHEVKTNYLPAITISNRVRSCSVSHYLSLEQVLYQVLFTDINDDNTLFFWSFVECF